MKLSNNNYDLLKNIALCLPLISTFIMAIFKIWNIPYATEIGLTLTSLNTLIAGIVQISNKNFKKSKKKGK